MMNTCELTESRIRETVAGDGLATGRSILASLRERARDAAGKRMLLGAGVCVALLTGVFLPNLIYFVYIWSTDENYSHGFLVPLISLYFADVAMRRGPIVVRGGVGLGVCLLLAGLAAKLSAVVIPIGIVAGLGLLASIAGMTALFLGMAGLARFGFAIGFLAFMIPLPTALYTLIANPLQLMVSDFASIVLNGIGVPVLREGNMMTLPGGVKMFVAEACSGLRQLTGFVALTTAMAYLSTRPRLERGLIMLSAIPIAMAANVARVVITGMIMHWINPSYAAGTFHTLEGLLMMGFGLALLALEGWCMAKLGALWADPKVAATGRIRPRPATT